MTQFEYDALYRNTRVIYPERIAETLNVYDVLSQRLVETTSRDFFGNVLSSQELAYDDFGNVTGVKEDGEQQQFEYDFLHRLTKAVYPDARGELKYGYDKRNNRVSFSKDAPLATVATYDDADQIISYMGVPHSYDDAGNLTNNGTHSFGWDGLNRLKSLDGSMIYDYDGDGYRYRRDNKFYYVAGGNLWLERDSSGAKRAYVPKISVVDQRGQKFFFLADAFGNTSKLLDQKGNLVQTYRYDAFGNELELVQDENGIRHRGSVGVFSDDLANLQYMHHRWYDPKSGRFISRDPIGGPGSDMYLYAYNRATTPQSPNTYAYGNCNPLTNSDPSGLWSTGGTASASGYLGVYPLLGATGSATLYAGYFSGSNSGFDYTVASSAMASDIKDYQLDGSGNEYIATTGAYASLSGGAFWSTASTTTELLAINNQISFGAGLGFAGASLTIGWGNENYLVAAYPVGPTVGAYGSYQSGGGTSWWDGFWNWITGDEEEE